MPRLNIYLPDDVVEEFDGKLEGRPRSKTIRKLIEGYNEGRFKIDWKA